MKTISKYILAALSLSLLATCKREDAQWDIGIVSPIATASLSMEDLVPGDYIVADTDSSLRVVYQNTIYTLPIDSFLKIPDTTFAYSLPPWPIDYTFWPNSQVPLTLNPLVFNISPAKLTRAVINSGTMSLKAVSSVNAGITFNYKIPKAKKDWAPFDAWGAIDAAFAPDSAYFYQAYDLSGYDIALNGNGTQYNVLPYTLTIKTGEDTAQVVQGQRLFNLFNTFQNVKPEFVEGYFGSQTTSYGPDTAAFKFLKNITGGTLDLQSINLGVTLENSIGADVRAVVKSVKGINTNTGNAVTLQHPFINSPMNVDRAINFGYNPAATQPTYAPSYKTLTFNNSNSNLAAFISNLPDMMEYKVDLTLNPLGNISGGKDFIYRDAGIKVNINLDMPLTFKSAGLTLVDTINYSVNAKQEDVDRYQGGSFKLFANNGFPLDASVQLILLDEFNQPVDTLLNPTLIQAAPVDANFKAVGQQQTIISFPVSIQKANNLVYTKKVAVKAVFDTKPQGQYLKMYSYYKLDLKLTSDFKFRMKL